MRDEGHDEPLTLCGTGSFVRLPSSIQPLLITASHCIPRDEYGEQLSLYVGVDQCVQLGAPLISKYCANPYDGIDFAVFDAFEIIAAAGGSKEAFVMNQWPVDDPTVGEEVVVVGYAGRRMQAEPEHMKLTMKLDAYAGRVTSTDRYVFQAEVGMMPPYADALPIDEAVGLSGSPCFRIKRVNEIESALLFCGVHRGAGGGAIFEQKVSVTAAILSSYMVNNGRLSQ
jgi:hypothetical protein